MKLLFANLSDRKLTLWVEPLPNQYHLSPGEEVIVDGELEKKDGAVRIDWRGDDVTVYDLCGEENEVLVTKQGARLKPDNATP